MTSTVRKTVIRVLLAGALLAGTAVASAFAVSCSSDVTEPVATVRQPIGGPSCSTAGDAGTTAPFVNVLDYGAIPNDGNSDVIAIKNAITAASGCYSSFGSGGTVYFPPGTYSIDSTIDLQGWGDGRLDGVRLIGASGAPETSLGGNGAPSGASAAGTNGTVLQACSGSGGGSADGGLGCASMSGSVLRASATNVSIENMTIDGNGLTNPAVIQFWYLSAGSYVHNVVLTGAKQALGGSCFTTFSCTSLVQLNGDLSDPSPGFGDAALYQGGTGQLCGSQEVAFIVFQNVSFGESLDAGSSTISDFAIDVAGSNAYPLMVRDSWIGGANDLVHLYLGASVDLENDALEPPSTGNGSIRLDDDVHLMTVANCHTEVAGPSFLYQHTISADGQNVLRLMHNQINASAPISFVPTQMMVLDGNLLGGNVYINGTAADAGYGKQNVVAVGNQFAGGAGFAGDAGAGQLQQIGTAEGSGFVYQTLANTNLSGTTNVFGPLAFGTGAQINYRVATTTNQSSLQDFSPLDVDEADAPTMIAAGYLTAEIDGAQVGARLRFVKAMPDTACSGSPCPITIRQYSTTACGATGWTCATSINPPGASSGDLQLNTSSGSIGWVELALHSGSPNYWAVSAWGKN